MRTAPHPVERSGGKMNGGKRGSIVRKRSKTIGLEDKETQWKWKQRTRQELRKRDDRKVKCRTCVQRCICLLALSIWMYMLVLTYSKMSVRRHLLCLPGYPSPTSRSLPLLMLVESREWTLREDSWQRSCSMSLSLLSNVIWSSRRTWFSSAISWIPHMNRLSNAVQPFLPIPHNLMCWTFYTLFLIFD